MLKFKVTGKKLIDDLKLKVKYHKARIEHYTELQKRVDEVRALQENTNQGHEKQYGSASAYAGSLALSSLPDYSHKLSAHKSSVNRCEKLITYIQPTAKLEVEYRDLQELGIV